MLTRNSVTSEHWGDGAGPIIEDRGRAEWHWVNAAGSSPYPNTFPWGPSTLHPSSPRTPVQFTLHPSFPCSGRAAAAGAGKSTTTWPRGHCVLDKDKLHWGKAGLKESCMQLARGWPPSCALFVGAAGRVPLSSSWEQRGQNTRLEGTGREWVVDGAGGKLIFSFLG